MTPDRLFAAMEATWPPVSARAVGPWRIRQGAGGGSRVSAASALGPLGPADLATAEAAMAGLGQAPLFMVRDGQAQVDALLAQAGYGVADPVQAWIAPVSELAAPVPPETTFEAWPPLAVQRDLWAEGGIGPARLAVMDRVTGPKIAILGRADDRPAACAFVACDGDLAMLHALEVTPALRRRGLGRHVLSAAARWAARQGAQNLALLVTRANVAANALYAGAGMRALPGYHYRGITG